MDCRQPKDEEILVGLMQLTKREKQLLIAELSFTKRELIDLLNWPKSSWAFIVFRNLCTAGRECPFTSSTHGETIRTRLGE